jgi:hypothetical protein
MKFREHPFIFSLFFVIIFLLFLFIVCYFSTTVTPVDYSGFPTDLQLVLDKRIDELNVGGGVCIAGRVTMSDGKKITGGKDVLVNLYDRGDVPLRVYEDGWFIMRSIRRSSVYAGPGRGFILRAFGYDPIDASVTILDGEMTYLEFVVQKTAPENLASVKGTVFDESDEPLSGANLSISFPFANLGTNNSPYIRITADSNGRYSFEGLSVTEHRVTAYANEYAYHTGKFTPQAGGTASVPRKLYRKRRIIIDYVYQANGSRNFTTGDLHKGTINWPVRKGGVDFSEGKVEGYEPDDLRDLEMQQDQGILKFRNFYVNGRNGFYDGGLVDFDSVVEANDTGYSTHEKLCLVGHVYVVRTYEEDNYAKFIVRSD